MATLFDDSGVIDERHKEKANIYLWITSGKTPL